MKIKISDIRDELLKLKKSHDNVSMCFLSEEKNNIFCPYQFKKQDITKILEKFRNSSYKLEKNLIQKETFFRDLVQMEISNVNDVKHNEINYFSKKTLLKSNDDILFVVTITNAIPIENFPKLFKYDHVDSKTLTLFEFESVNVIITKNSNDFANIHINIKNLKKDILTKELTIIINILKDFIE